MLPKLHISFITKNNFDVSTIFLIILINMFTQSPYKGPTLINADIMYSNYNLKGMYITIYILYMYTTNINLLFKINPIQIKVKRKYFLSTLSFNRKHFPSIFIFQTPSSREIINRWLYQLSEKEEIQRSNQFWIIFQK